MITDACIIRGMASSDYHADQATPEPSLSNSVAKVLLARSPRHARLMNRRLNPDFKPTNKRTFDIGKAAHRQVLGVGDDIAVYPKEALAKNGATSTNAAAEFEAWARSVNRIPLKQDDADRIDNMATALAEALEEYPEPIRFDAEAAELACFAVIDRVWCRCMIDHALTGADTIDDFKTTEDASPEAVRRAIENFGYDVQAEHYKAIWKAITGETRRFRFIFQEKEPPYEVGVYYLADHGEADWTEHAADKIREARETWRQCLDTGYWPGLPRQEAIIPANTYHLSKWDNRTRRPSVAALAAARRFQAPTGEPK